MHEPIHWGKRLSIHLEINNVCNASCPMCYDRNYINENGDLRSHPRSSNVNLSMQKLTGWFDNKFYESHSLKKLTICGTESEPTLNPDLGPMICYVKDRQRATLVRVSTNGSTNNQDWWFSMGRLMRKYGSSVQFIFSIDGIGDSHEMYRLGTSYEKTILNAKAFIAGGGSAIWQFLVFRHNEHQVDVGRKLASELGFYDFYLKYSNYFKRDGIERLQYRHMGEQYSLEESTRSQEACEDAAITNTSISCYSFGSREVFIDYEGYLYPCSWFKSSLRGSFGIKSPDDAWRVVREFRTKRCSLDNRSIHQILGDKQLWKDLSDAWNNATLRPLVCEMYCTSVGNNAQCSFQMKESGQILSQAMIK